MSGSSVSRLLLRFVARGLMKLNPGQRLTMIEMRFPRPVVPGEIICMAEDGCVHWRRIPYTAAPVDPRRFRASVTAEPWEGRSP